MARDPNFRAMLLQAGVSYPRVTNLGNGSFQKEVNRAIKRAAYQAVPDYDPGTPIVEAQSGYTTPLNAQGVLSLRFQDYFYPEMAAHGVTGVSSITLDLRNGHIYKFDELFLPNSGYQARLTRIIEAQIASRQIPMLQPYPGVGTQESFYLTPDSLVIYYQPYVYTPGYFGVLEFTIPYVEIRDIIDPQGPIGRFV